MRDTAEREIGKRRSKSLDNIRLLVLRALKTGGSLRRSGRKMTRVEVERFAAGDTPKDDGFVRNVRRWAIGEINKFERETSEDHEMLVSMGEVQQEQPEDPEEATEAYGMPEVDADSPIPGAIEDAEHIQRRKKETLLRIMDTGENSEKIQAMKLLGEIQDVDMETETPEEIQGRIDTIRNHKGKCLEDIEKIETLVEARAAQAKAAAEAADQGVRTGGDETPSPDGGQASGATEGPDSPETSPPAGEAVPTGEVHSGLCPVPSGDDKPSDHLQPAGVCSSEGPRENNP
jgi:hypothetical protein